MKTNITVNKNKKLIPSKLTIFYSRLETKKGKQGRVDYTTNTSQLHKKIIIIKITSNTSRQMYPIQSSLSERALVATY